MSDLFPPHEKLIEENTFLKKRIQELEQSESKYKLAQEALKGSEEKFRKAFYMIPDAVSISRMDNGLYVSVNPSFSRITGYTEEELLGNTSVILEIWGYPKDRETFISRLQKEGHVKDLEAAFRMKNGEVRQGLLAASMIELNGIPHLLSITRDVTEQKQLEQEKENLIIKLEKALSEVRQLSGLLPICSACKKIRDDQGYWTQIETYLLNHSTAEFTHAICPECAEKLYPAYIKK